MRELFSFLRVNKAVDGLSVDFGIEYREIRRRDDYSHARRGKDSFSIWKLVDSFRGCFSISRLAARFYVEESDYRGAVDVGYFRRRHEHCHTCRR